jgi:predicted oxidoreductase
MQFSIAHTGMIDFGLTVNTLLSQSNDRDDAILDYCRLKDITIQAWSPFQFGFLDGVFIDNTRFPALNERMGELARIKEVT